MMTKFWDAICITRPQWFNTTADNFKATCIDFDKIFINFSGAEARKLWENYRKNSSISRTKSQSLNDSHLVLQLSLPTPGVK